MSRTLLVPSSHARWLGTTVAALAVVTALCQSVQAQGTPSGRARLGGRVIDAVTLAPLGGANIIIEGTAVTATTSVDGKFVILSAPTGVHAINVRRLGFAPLRLPNVRLLPDSVSTFEFKMSTSALRLDQVVVSGTVEATSIAMSTTAIDRLSAEEMPVSTTSSAAGAIMGKVAGAAVMRPSGRPGSGVNIVLRTPIGGIDQVGGVAGGSSPGPLFVVDGVFLNATQQTTTQDIEALDIASIEVLKGAAAAALYGSRAAAGVISITTNRGKNLALGTSEFTLRSEYGRDQFWTTQTKNQHHAFLSNSKGEWLDALGNVVPRFQRVVKPLGIMDAPYLIPTYDHAGQMYKPSSYQTLTATVQGNSASTNYNASFSRTVAPGVVQYNDGYSRQSFRVNVDSRVNEKLNLSFSVNHSRGEDEVPATNFSNFFRFDTDVNLLSKDPFPKKGFPYNIIPDSVTQATNPLYSEFAADNHIKRARTLLSTNAVFRPFDWLSILADFSYDRGDLQQVAYTPKGIPTNNGLTLSTSTGSLNIQDDITDGLTFNFGPTITKVFGALTTRLTLRGDLQRESNPFISSTGTDFTSEGLKAMSAARTKTVTQSYTDRRAAGTTSSLNLSYKEKYVGDFLVRREGSSLFGAAARWNTFYKAGGAWLLSEERWFPLPSFSLFKLRYSVGTAGNRPSFTAQYEALSSDGTGGVTRGTLGNPALTPTVSREQEIGLDMTFKQRVTASITYATNQVADVFVSVPAPAVSGYSNVLRNTGNIVGNTIEMTLQGQVLSQPNGLQWSMLFVGDKTANRVTQFRRSCFADGLTYRCDGVRLGEMWGNRMVTNKANLIPEHANSGDQFAINDEGFVVAVGTGNKWTEGVSKNLWGTTVVIDGKSYKWGNPIVEVDPVTRQLQYGKIGDGNPDFHFGWSNTFRYKNFKFFVQTTGQVGGDVYGNSNQTFYASGDHPNVDNFGRADSLKKPVAYYNSVSNNNNLFLANFVEKATHLTISEMDFGYTFDGKSSKFLQKVGVNRLQVDLIGRNLRTFTNYTGLNVNAGSPQNRFDDATYPLTRTYSLVFNITF